MQKIYTTTILLLLTFISRGQMPTGTNDSMFIKSFFGIWKIKDMHYCQVVGKDQQELDLLKGKKMTVCKDRIILFDEDIKIKSYKVFKVNADEYIYNRTGCLIDFKELNFTSDSVSVIEAISWPYTSDFFFNGSDVLINLDGVFFTLKKVSKTEK